MTESTNTRTNYRQSGSNNNDNPLDLFVVPIHKDKHVDDKFGLYDDDDEEDNLTLFDLKPIPISDHDLSIFDELAHQCDAVLFSSNFHPQTLLSTGINNSHSSCLTTTMINDYEQRFQCSLQKLTIPSWYNDTAPSPKLSSKPSIISTTHYNRETHRTPEIVHVRRPHSHRSCHSSVATSPSPSAHSWHPNHLMDGVKCSFLVPSSSSISSRRSNKYEKGIERIAKSTRWYQPTQFVANTQNDHIGILTGSITNTPVEHKNSDENHYDVPKIHYGDNDLSNRIKKI